MLAKYCSIIFYSAAVVAQCVAAAYAVNLFFRSKSYRLASGVLALGFSLMIGRRIAPLLLYYADGYFNLFDALLAFVISMLLFLGLSQVKRIILELEEKNFRLDHTAKTDSLTQILSRAETFSRAEQEIERSLRSRKPIAFLMLDIDHFKNVNDQFGHPVGDIVLQNLAKYCQEELRVIDIFGRVGGEEFLIALPESSESLAFDVAERLRKKIATSVVAIVNGKEVSITISIGVASFDPVRNGENAADLILRSCYQKADEAMYLAKAKGRNRTECWSC
ncbi:GGDEF domain-containing protein [Polynucleobacter sp. UK-Kesae-W10]|uniref:GGDEF domain-containing protein n=1 Tax=Polynucleobacter sp. UK-Kesae-W10 TaxID=1819738 RepID=UPI001C0DDB2D|nr:GGDEF domain-containing protein [Polynucleobacter sp. UK-Kesae-W10]MBU3577831.1 GGDEF domain-containing protein [Polynucleobacter sp. UK-Kesae-W10]